jgi:hypothetical protein
MLLKICFTSLGSKYFVRKSKISILQTPDDTKWKSFQKGPNDDVDDDNNINKQALNRPHFITFLSRAICAA